MDRYDLAQSYRWNYEHPPVVQLREAAVVPGTWTYCGRRVPSPLGMPAGPLLNGRWVLYYANLGFDVLTYKTVRSVARECYGLPNLQPVEAGQLDGTEADVPATESMAGSWAVSFGMPSASPEKWRADVEWTRNRLSAEKLLSVSVVGSIQPDWTIDDLADDYAQCARWAVQSGADCIESNFSCPNVSTCDGQLHQQPESAGIVAERVRAAIGDVPYVVKIGHVTGKDLASELLEAFAPHTDALATTNSVATRVKNAVGELLFDGQPRGICGDGTRHASVSQVKLFAGLIAEKSLDIKVIGVGGASTAEHVREYLAAGAESVHIATAAMIDPEVGLKIRAALAAD